MAKQASRDGLDWYTNARFGMFIHWGLYSLLGRGEWVLHNERIPLSEYEPLAQRFNPTRFNAREWVSIAADAGQKYMVITSRHHDGFSMYDTALSDYKITNTPFKRDPLAELANECARRGDVKLGFYNSLLDWRHPAYRFRDKSGMAWEDYVAFLHGQVRELCTGYGQVACIWFDGDWPRQSLDDSNAYFAAGGSFEYEKLYEMIHTLQPDAVIHNNRHAQPIPGEDVQGFEQDLPGENSVGFNTTEIYDMPIEVCMTINDNWGIHFDDDNHKSAGRLVEVLVRSAAVGGNLLLNVGPTAEGEILPVHVKRLQQVGAWLRVNGESIHGAGKGIIRLKEGVSTFNGMTHYVHIFKHVTDRVYLESVPSGLTRARLLSDGTPVRQGLDRGRLYLSIPAEQRDAFDTVVALEG